MKFIIILIFFLFCFSLLMLNKYGKKDTFRFKWSIHTELKATIFYKIR